MIRGVDVSSHNGRQDWPALVAQGVRFAAVRVSSGRGADRTAAAHLEAARAAGVEVLLAYHYVTDAPAAEQAEVFLGAVAALEAQLGVDLGLALDLEDLPGHPPWPREAYEATAREVCRLVREARRRPCGVYLSPEFARQLDLAWWWADCPLWLARWAPSPGAPPAPWGAITIWQNAVTAGLDRDVFAGTVEELRAAFRIGTWSAPLATLGRVVEIGDATLPRDPTRAATVPPEGPVFPEEAPGRP